MTTNIVGKDRSKAVLIPVFEGKMSKNWISKAIEHPGSLRKSLHVPEGKNIPAKKLEKASNSDNPTLAKRANLAMTLKKLHKRHGGDV